MTKSQTACSVLHQRKPQRTCRFSLWIWTWVTRLHVDSSVTVAGSNGDVSTFHFPELLKAGLNPGAVGEWQPEDITRSGIFYLLPSTFLYFLTYKSITLKLSHGDWTWVCGTKLPASPGPGIFTDPIVLTPCLQFIRPDNRYRKSSLQLCCVAAWCHICSLNNQTGGSGVERLYPTLGLAEEPSRTSSCFYRL